MDVSEYEFREERNLEDYIINSPDSIEKGLKILGHQVPTVGNRRIDILAVNSEERLIVLELKIVEDDRMLIQGLEYIDWVNENADRIVEIYKSSNLKINPKVIPSLILVAPTFSRTLRTAAKYVRKDYCYLMLFEYIGLKDSFGKQGLIRREVSIKPIERPLERWNLQNYLDHFDNPEIRTLFQDIIKDVRNIGPNIKCKPTQSWYVALQYKGRNICSLSPRKQYFYLWIRGGDYIKINDSKDFNQEILEKIIKAYKDLGGKLKTIP